MDEKPIQEIQAKLVESCEILSKRSYQKLKSFLHTGDTVGI